MAIHISEPGNPVGTRLPQAFRARRVTGKDAPEATRPSASNTDRPVDHPVEQQQVRRALKEYEEESGVGPDAQSPYLGSERLASHILVTISARESLEMALSLMEQRSVHHLVVVTDDGEVAGLVDEQWVLRQLRQNGDVGESLASMELPAFITVTPETDAHHLAQQMLGYELSAALVIDRNNQPAGIITNTDFLRLYAEGYHLHARI